jgi:hypothetical protein
MSILSGPRLLVDASLLGQLLSSCIALHALAEYDAAQSSNWSHGGDHGGEPKWCHAAQPRPVIRVR